jgi:hypothetical protein
VTVLIVAALFTGEPRVCHPDCDSAIAPGKGYRLHQALDGDLS